MWTLEQPDQGFLTAPEKAIVAAAFSQLVPGDVVLGIPGAADSGAVEFLDLLLARPKSVYVEIPAWGEFYRKVLPLFDRASIARHGKGVAALSASEAVNLLQLLQAGLLPVEPGFEEAVQRRLFDTLHRHAVQGCFSDPRWGGNRDRVMWKWFGYLQPAEER